MPKLPATDRFQKLVDDISRLYADARQAQVRFAWETGKRIVEEEQNGEMRAKIKEGYVLIDCPEMSTPQGVRAKKYVEKLLPVDSTVVINSHKCKTDTYGRFVADVFFKEGVKAPSGLLKDAVYLNQHLLDSGHAVRMAE